MPKFELRSAILCDEVRREDSGRAIIIGASPSGPSVPEGGKTLSRLAFYIEMVLSDVEFVEVRLWNSTKGKEITIGEFEFSSPEELLEDEEVLDEAIIEIIAVMVANRNSVAIPAPGEYALQFALNHSGEWKTETSYIFPEQVAE